MTPQQIDAMKLALEALETERDIYREHDEDGAPEYILDAITALEEVLSEHAMQEVQRLGQEIEQCQCTECQIKPHASDCAVHSEPAYPKGKCDCGAQPQQEPPKYSFKAHWEKDGRIGVVGAVVRPDGGVHLLQDFIDPPQRTEPVIEKSAAKRIATALGWEPKRKPLTKEEMFEAIRPLYSSDKAARLTVNHSEDEYRAIEAAHGIKENT